MIKIFKDTNIEWLECSVNEFLEKECESYKDLHFTTEKYCNQIIYIVLIEGVELYARI